MLGAVGDLVQYDVNATIFSTWFDWTLRLDWVRLLQRKWREPGRGPWWSPWWGRELACGFRRRRNVAMEMAIVAMA